MDPGGRRAVPAWRGHRGEGGCVADADHRARPVASAGRSRRGGPGVCWGDGAPPGPGPAAARGGPPLPTHIQESRPGWGEIALTERWGGGDDSNLDARAPCKARRDRSAGWRRLAAPSRSAPGSRCVPGPSGLVRGGCSVRAPWGRHPLPAAPRHSSPAGTSESRPRQSAPT